MTEQENLQMCWLRAIEWGKWPLFVTQPLVPVLFLFFTWWKVIIWVMVFSWLWTLIRYKFVSLTLANAGAILVTIKWPIAILMGIILFCRGDIFPGLISVFWPIITLCLLPLVPPNKIGEMQKIFMKQLGYKPTPLNPLYDDEDDEL